MLHIMLQGTVLGLHSSSGIVLSCSLQRDGDEHDPPNHPRWLINLPATYMQVIQSKARRQQKDDSEGRYSHGHSVLLCRCLHSASARGTSHLAPMAGSQMPSKKKAHRSQSMLCCTNLHSPDSVHSPVLSMRLVCRVTCAVLDIGLRRTLSAGNSSTSSQYPSAGPRPARRPQATW